MNKFLVFTLLILVISCAQVNQDSKGFYESKKTMRHGIIPVQKDISQHVANLKYDEVSARRGKVVYEQHCLSCHGRDGLGSGPDAEDQALPPANLVETARNVPSFKFFIMASRYKGTMPGWKSLLSEKELRDVENYIRSLAKVN
ncbi:MAG: c-type cytochrome [Oligoflexia bacterium]|nr:c-type cytochrome [Oligoflexia bacterium]